MTSVAYAIPLPIKGEGFVLPLDPVDLRRTDSLGGTETRVASSPCTARASPHLAESVEKVIRSVASPADLLSPLRFALVDRVRGLFNDRSRGERPVERSADALFAPGSMVWRVHGDVTTMMVGGVAALLLQMLHPAALAGVIDFSNFRADMLGRLRRTARFVALTTYGERTAAEAAIERVRSIHAQVEGILPDGTPYQASDPHLLAWVHVAEAVSFLDAWIRFAEPNMSRADQDLYFAEFAIIPRALGASPVPETRAAAEALISRMRPELRVTRETREVAGLLLSQRLGGPAAAPLEAALAQSAVDLLPRWASRMLELDRSRFSRPLVHAATLGAAATLRWAFDTGPARG